VLTYDGYIKVYMEEKEESEEGEEGALKLPNVSVGEKLKLEKMIPGQHFTKPPPRFTEAGLVKELEEDGIVGRRRTPRFFRRFKIENTPSRTKGVSSLLISVF